MPQFNSQNYLLHHFSSQNDQLEKLVLNGATAEFEFFPGSLDLFLDLIYLHQTISTLILSFFACLRLASLLELCSLMVLYTEVGQDGVCASELSNPRIDGTWENAK